MQTVTMTTAQKQAASEAFRKIYLDFDGLKKVIFDPIPNGFELMSYQEHACHHMNTFVDSN